MPIDIRACPLFQLAQMLGWCRSALHALSAPE
jgi:hypothetical protein